MKILKSFEEYLYEGIAKKVSPDLQRAENLILESKRKYSVLQKTIEKMRIDDDNANDYIESSYNIIIFIIRAKMLEQGFTSSGQGAHEAEVVFTKNLGWSEQEIRQLDQLRYFRNGILYYGKKFDRPYAEKVILFTKKMYKKMIYSKSSK